MEQSTAQRRLVKSPPELWAEVSCEDALGRRLAQFGEIRITRLEPETTVAWEGERASGTVELAPAGWGTKVVLTAKPARPPAAAATPNATAAPPAAASAVQRPPEPKPDVVEPAPAAVAAAPTPAPALVRPPSPRPAEPAAPPAPEERKLGFFARFFRRPPAEPAPVAYRFPPASDPVQAPAATSPTLPPATPEPSPPALGPEPPPPDPDLAPTLPRPAAAPPANAGLDTERTVAILTEVLDDLGAAHHRPFSRDELS